MKQRAPPCYKVCLAILKLGCMVNVMLVHDPLLSLVYPVITHTSLLQGGTLYHVYILYTGQKYIIILWYLHLKLPRFLTTHTQ